jgi:DNA-binding transcriptional LysR family regulator
MCPEPGPPPHVFAHNVVCKNTHVDWDGLRVFLAVARAGRISVAARKLGVEHTTVSRRLAGLEAALGAPLFHRTAAGYLPTPFGQEILPTAENIERAAEGIGLRARESTGRISGRVRLAVAPEFASHWLVPHLPAFRARHPELDLQILVGTRQRDLSRGEAELAVQSPRPRQSGLVAVRIGRATTVLYASKHLVRGPRMRIESAEDLRDIPLLTFTAQFHLLQEAVWFQPVLASARVVLETNSTHALLAAARASLGIAVLPRFVGRTDDTLVAVSAPVAEQDVWLVTHPEFRRDPRVRVAADFLKRVATGALGLS